MLVVYIAAPFTGKTGWEIEENVRRAERLALRVWEAGAIALCPHTNSRFFYKVLPDQVFIDGTLELMRRCDALLMALDWKESRGARNEHAEAARLNMPIFYANSEYSHNDALPADLVSMIIQG